MTRDEVNYIIGKAIVRCIGFLVLLLAGASVALLMSRFSEKASAGDQEMTVEKASSICRQEGYRNWIREDFRWKKHTVQCFNKQWKLKEIVIK